MDEGDEDIISNRIKIGIEIICQLYGNKFITDAYIVGSTARGTTRPGSDIDILIINPLFEGDWDFIDFYFLQSIYNEDPNNEALKEFPPIVLNILKFLQNMGIGSIFMERTRRGEIQPELVFFQTYKGELIQITGDTKVSDYPRIRIARTDCEF